MDSPLWLLPVHAPALSPLLLLNPSAHYPTLAPAAASSKAQPNGTKEGPGKTLPKPSTDARPDTGCWRLPHPVFHILLTSASVFAAREVCLGQRCRNSRFNSAPHVSRIFSRPNLPQPSYIKTLP